MTRQFNTGFKSIVAMRKIQQTKKGARQIENQRWRSRQKLEYKKQKKGGSLDRKPEMAVQAKIRANKKKKKREGEEEEEGKDLLDQKPKVAIWIEIKEIKQGKQRWRQIIQQLQSKGSCGRS